ncbi:MAG: type II secretion system protein [Erysipelotrichaceae bacterium]|nr:type II secretion system protein [Erysipelotrichaceae bacterium]
MKKLNKKGFTLAELLIVVAIIAVLVAISIPIFTAQLNKAKYAADEANARSIYSEMVADYLANGGEQKLKLDNTQIQENVANQTVTVTYADNSTNKYKFSGIVEINFTKGETSKYPKVVIEPCTKAGVDDSVTFGEGTASTGN